MLRKHRRSKQSKRQWARVVLFGSVLGVGLGGASESWAQVKSLSLPPATTYGAGAQSASSSRLQVYEVPSELIGQVGAQIQVHYHSDPEVRVTTDPKTGQLMIMASEAVHREIAAQISGFMKQHKIPAGDRGVNLASYNQQSYALQNLSWRELEDSIQRLAGSRLTQSTDRNGELSNLEVSNSTGRSDIIQIDRRANKVTLLGEGPTVAGWTQVVYSLDRGQADPSRLTQVVPLAPAEPRRVKRAMQLVKTTIQQDAAGGNVEAQVELGDNERAMAMGSIDSLGSDSGLFGDVQIEFVEEIDLVIIRGSKRDVERTLKVIDEIKRQAKETQPEVEVFPLKHANGEAVAALVTQLYDAVYAPRQGTVSITALGQPNALLIIGRAEVVKSVKELIDKIDQPLDPANQLKVIPLQHASSEDLQTRIREFFVAKPGGDTADRPNLGTKVKVLSDYRTNSLIIQAAPREMAEVEALINQLDVETAVAQSGLRVFRLKNTLSDDLQTVIQEVISGPTDAAGGGAGTATPPSGKITIVGEDGRAGVESGILAGVVVTSDPSANALLVRAPAQSMELIARLIEELDKQPSAEAKIKVYPIENGDATQLSQTLQQLYGLQVTAGQNTSGGLFGLGNLNQAALTGGGESSLVQLSITPEIRTNSIIVSGSSSDLEVIEALLYRLDIEGVENRKTEVIWLRNATAQSVSTALNTYITSQRSVNQLLTQTNQFISVFDQVDREVFVVPDLDTNSLILSATSRYFETMRNVIDRLDRRPPLVEIQVLIAEVNLSDGFELGTEWGLQDGLLFDRQASSGGTLTSPVFNIGNAITGPSIAGPGAEQQVAGQGLSSFAMGRTNAAGIGGLVLSASSEAVGVLVRALQTSGRLQVLSNPQITTMDGRPASTLVGQLVPRVSGVTQAQFGQTVNAPDTQVGLQIQVLPRVNQDGLILMQIVVTNSSLDNVNPGIPVGFGVNGEVIRSPIINETTANSTVSAYSGQTVVFAGLITKSRASTRQQVPILGSLPIIGAAFRFDTETESRKELLVVLTPRLIQSDSDYETVKTVASSRMSWCLGDVLNVHGDVGLTGGNGLWGPARSATIYPDLQPTMLEDHAVPNSGRGMNEFPGMYEGVPLGQDGGSIIESTSAPELNTNAALQPSNSVFKPAGYTVPSTTPAQPTTPVQRTAY